MFYVPSIPSPRVKILAVIQCQQCGIIHKAFKLYFPVLECHQNFPIELQLSIQLGVPFSAWKLLTSISQHLQGLQGSSKPSSALCNPSKTSSGTLGRGTCSVLFFANNTYLYAQIKIHPHIYVSLISVPWFGNISMFTFKRW